MIEVKIPKRLKLDRSCFYHLPDEEKPDLPGYELFYRDSYNGMFHSRVGHYFFFELPTPAARDAFLTSLEVSCKQAKIRVERAVIYPLTKPK